jgi:hypothetical protein
MVQGLSPDLQSHSTEQMKHNVQKQSYYRSFNVLEGTGWVDAQTASFFVTLPSALINYNYFIILVEICGSGGRWDSLKDAL